MQRTWAIIERDLRRFRRSPALIIMSLLMPIVQLVVLGYAFGGNVKHLKVALVDEDGGVPAVRLHALANAVAENAQTFETIPYGDRGQALAALRNGQVNGVLTIPPGFSRRVLSHDDPRVALIEDNTDNFVTAALAGTFGSLLGAYNSPPPSTRRLSIRPDTRDGRALPVRAVHPVPAARFHRDVDLHDGDDRRRDHLTSTTKRAACTRATSSRRSHGSS